jgi:Tol biopolymer transport system component
MKSSIALRLGRIAVGLGLGLSLAAQETAPAAKPSPAPTPSVKAGIGVGKVAFEQQGAIKVADLVSGQITPFDLPERMEAPSWGPDGQKFLYNSDFGLSLLDIPGQSFAGLTPASVKAQNAAWSADGRQAAYDVASGETGLYVYDLAEKKSTRVPLAVQASRAAWHPGGASLLFTAPVGGVDQLFTLALGCLKDGSCEKAAVQLTKGTRPSRGGVYSPDGAWIAFESEEGGVSGIYVMKADGGGARRLSPPKSSDRNPAWGGNDRLAFDRENAQGGRDAFLMKSDGSGAEELVKDARNPSWWVPKK